MAASNVVAASVYRGRYSKSQCRKMVEGRPPRPQAVEQVAVGLVGLLAMEDRPKPD